MLRAVDLELLKSNWSNDHKSLEFSEPQFSEQNGNVPYRQGDTYKCLVGSN